MWLMTLAHNVEGQDLVEYALAAGAMALACCAIIPQIAMGAGGLLGRVGSVLLTVNSPSPGVQ